MGRLDTHFFRLQTASVTPSIIHNPPLPGPGPSPVFHGRFFEAQLLGQPVPPSALLHLHAASRAHVKRGFHFAPAHPAETCQLNACQRILPRGLGRHLQINDRHECGHTIHSRVLRTALLRPHRCLESSRARRCASRTRRLGRVSRLGFRVGLCSLGRAGGRAMLSLAGRRVDRRTLRLRSEVWDGRSSRFDRSLGRRLYLR